MRVTLYTKPQCPLCDDVMEIIEHVRRSRPFTLELRNILDDLADYEKYKHDIPVVLVNGRKIARHRMTQGQLEEALGQRHLPPDRAE